MCLLQGKDKVVMDLRPQISLLDASKIAKELNPVKPKKKAEKRREQKKTGKETNERAYDVKETDQKKTAPNYGTFITSNITDITNNITDIISRLILEKETEMEARKAEYEGQRKVLKAKLKRWKIRLSALWKR